MPLLVHPVPTAHIAIDEKKGASFGPLWVIDRRFFGELWGKMGHFLRKMTPFF
ncbi:MAG: hypothetical protein MPJ24_03725 [Pirellulaceae bacterium]|nr:hypothetical protein [Pirellulaceae bacterium]